MKKDKTPELSIIIPLYNEEKRFPKSFKKIDQYFSRLKFTKEYILVDDGSSDKTLSIVKKLKSKDRSPIKIISEGVNRGKGFALKLGVKNSKGKNIFFTDADLSTPIEEFNKLYSHLKNNDMVIGSRRLHDSDVQIKQPFHRRFLGKIFYILFSLFFTKNVKDTNCGFKCYKGTIARALYSKITNDRWGFDAELIYLAEKYKYSIKEIPVIWLNDPFSRVSTLNASINTIFELVKIKKNDFLGIYDSKSEETMSQRALENILNIFFYVFFAIFGEPTKNKSIKETIDLYKGTGFQETFSKIRFWDAPLESIEKHTPVKGTIIDLGAGDGLLSNYLAICSAKRKIIGIELNERRVKQADKGLSNVSFIKGDVLKENIKQADAVILTHVLHHLPSKKSQEDLLNLITPKLKKGGVLLITEIGEQPFFKYLFTWFTDAVIVPILFEGKIYNPNFYYRNTKEWQLLLKKIGYKVKVSYPHNRKPFSHVLLTCTKE